jgi:hypothetical protein
MGNLHLCTIENSTSNRSDITVWLPCWLVGKLNPYVEAIVVSQQIGKVNINIRPFGELLEQQTDQDYQ